MGNDIEIRVTGSDASGPALLAATRNAQSLRDIVAKVGTSMRTAAGHARRLSDELDRLAVSAAGAGVGLARLDTDLSSTSRETAGLDERVDGLRQALDGLARSEGITAAGERYRGLAHEIKQVEGGVRSLSTEVDRSGSKGLLGRLLPGDGETRRTGLRIGARLGASVAEGLAGAGEKAADVFGKSLASLPPQAQAAIGAGVVTAVGAASTLIGASVGAAVVGAAGAGGIAGGIAVAAKHPLVQAAAAQTGDTLTRELQRAAVSFVPATVQSLGVVRSKIDGIGDDLERAFSSLAPQLPGLTEDVMAGAARAAEGFAAAAEHSGPILTVIGGIAERVGDIIGDTFEGLSEHADAGAHALAALWAVFEFGIRSIAGTIEGLTAAYGWLEKFGAVLTGDTATLGRLAAEQEMAKTSGSGLSESLQELIDGFQNAGDKAAAAAVEVESLNDALKRLTGENLNVEQANLRLEEAIDRATEAGKRNNDGIDASTEKGRANRQLLLDLAAAANTAAEATFTQTGSHELAAQAAERGREKFLAAAKAMGVEKTEAQRLADQLFAIPNINRSITITANTEPAIDSARNVVARINGMRARINVYAEPHGSFGGSAHTGEGYSTGRDHGGITGAASGGIRGHLTLVGERGPELLELPPSTMVHPTGTTQRMLSGGSGSLTVYVYAGYVTTPQDLEDTLTRTLDDLLRQGRLDQLAVAA